MANDEAKIICITLLRGINVGGKNLLPMKELVVLIEAIGATHVKTYIQSGNAIFQIQASHFNSVASRIENKILEHKGFKANVSVLKSGEMEKVMAKNPFPDAVYQPQFLHLYFLSAKPPSPDFGKVESLKAETEQFSLIDKVFYLHAPEGIGRSKLAAHVEKLMGVQATARNWRTVSKILSLAHDLSDST
jgi:uncharacterized protein (DUF1697 family)